MSKHAHHQSKAEQIENEAHKIAPFQEAERNLRDKQS